MVLTLSDWLTSPADVGRGALLFFFQRTKLDFEFLKIYLHYA